MTSSLPLSTDRAAASVVNIESLRKQPKDLPVIIRAWAPTRQPPQYDAGRSDRRGHRGKCHCHKCP
ncbi:MAG: hypothetical protein ACLTBP_08740 [Frisingicoccus sp.]